MSCFCTQVIAKAIGNRSKDEEGGVELSVGGMVSTVPRDRNTDNPDELVVINDPKLKDYSPTTRLAFAKFKSNLNKGAKRRQQEQQLGSASVMPAHHKLPPLEELSLKDIKYISRLSLSKQGGCNVSSIENKRSVAPSPPNTFIFFILPTYTVQVKLGR